MLSPAPLALAAVSVTPATMQAPAPASLTEGQRLFYVGRYEQAAAMALALREANPDQLAAYELRTSALHFQIKRLLGEPKDREKALRECGACAALIAEMQAETRRGQDVARARLLKTPADVETTFYLGKLDLNYVWLVLSTLGKRTGWTEYREARRSIEAVLKADRSHVRARVAHAWIEYIVDTRVPLGLKWVLGGGNRTGALRSLREATTMEADYYARVEAEFALWEMLARDRKFADAAVVARTLSQRFPENAELTRFIAEHGASPSQ